MKIFGDLHLLNNDIIDNTIISFLKKEIKKDDTVVFLGDVFNDFNVGVKNESFYNFLSTLTNQVYIIEGNHDFSRGRNALKIVSHFLTIFISYLNILQ